ncbi:ferrous iron transporter C [Chimaeribacter arupi]|uniref:Ferrous iron transporter C n=1 Tax=Nissabacter archeti TaxID=1917880 RepID=A0ABS5JDP7_9GAMM|nr:MULTISPECIES: FeoC-like transcriptional regulator [Yersiniaceae]MBS0968076.1 ferrous iron transporter C [Nissabacter archeti]MDV5140695.1 FeoC-like transcriptional regulator [Chimaeribacter arupi]PLR33861.1 ferrous iron transporter C [Chimaeribacter arupi]PLR50350.1 ferrous iron transporter C [Chimaeribacter arupi]PLR54445.1 ferrous iron transporter C [Chimaeribacter arupi]
MNPLLEVYHLLALHGSLDMAQLQQRCRVPPAMLTALLSQLERMKKIEPVPAAATGCPTGACGDCPASTRCAPVRYRVYNASNI